MRTIRQVAGRELLWVWAGDKKAYELRAGDEVAASLRWERESLASGETGDQRWTFNQEGFWYPPVTVQVPGSDDEATLFRPSWRGGGTLEFEADREFRFVSANLWNTQWDWLDERGRSLVHFKILGGFFSSKSQVVIEKRARTSPETPLLVVLGWYRLIQNARDTQPDV
jgi:hypothetical protein